MTIDHAAQELLSVLEQIQQLLLDLLDGEDTKYEALRSIDIEKLIASNTQEEEILSRFDQLESKRMEWVERFSILSGCAPEASLSEIAERSGAFKESFLKIGEHIRGLNERISLAAERNQYILASNGEIIGSILDLMEGRSTRYDQKGEGSSEKHNLHVVDHTV